MIIAITTFYRKEWRFWLGTAITMLIVWGCASVERNIRDDHSQSMRNELVSTALSMEGKPYRYGGETPAGFDCSGLVVYSYNKLGIQVPRTSYKQYKASKPVYISRMQPGDLIFFRTDSIFVSHVGIYIGDDRFVHAAGKRNHVRVDDLNKDYWQKRLVGAGSFIN